MSFRFALLMALGVVVLTATAAVAQPDSYDYRSWGTVADTLRNVETGKRITLTSPFIVVGSDTVFVGNLRLRRHDYTINYHMGTLRIDVPIPAGAIVVASYRRQPVMLKPVYALRPIEVADPEAPPEIPPERVLQTPTPRQETPRNLVFGGSKSVSFIVGSNRGSTLDQDLQATIEGQITPTIKVRALLSDNNLPIQPQGNTEELQYFDKVFVEIEGTRARATLGDFRLQNDISTFSPISRELKGASAAVWDDDIGLVSASGATNKGSFRRIQFRGITGLQGPYELLSAGRINGEVIIAGTEVVLVAGNRMRRGQNQDYFIDYDAGTITFTPRHLITRDTEISVDFQVTLQSYDRSAVFATGEDLQTPGETRLELLFAQEGDNKNDPRNMSFSEEDIVTLERAGDDPAAAVTGGVTQVAAGEGMYLLVPPDTLVGTPGFFVFDDSTGDYNVQFVEVPTGNGNYRLGGISRTGQRYYEFTPDSTGSYIVGRALPLPERRTVLTARLMRKETRHLTFDAEWNVSDYDANLFSPLDDENNVGQAGRAELGLGNIPVGLGMLALKGSVNTLEENFNSFDRPRPQFFYRDWNLENIPLVGRELMADGEATFARSETLTLRYNLGSLRRDEIDGVKHEGKLMVGSVASRGINARAFDSNTESPGQTRTRRHLTAEGSFAFWKVVPTVTWGSERYQEDATVAPDSGLAYELVRVRLARRNPQALSLHVDAERRETDQIDPATDEWYHARTDRTLGVGMSSRHFESIQGELQFTHRVEDNTRFGVITSDLARVKTTIRSKGTGIRSDVDYEIISAASRTLEASVVFVGEGNGDYNAQGELVGKDRGAFSIIYSPTEFSVATNNVSLNLRFVWKPFEGTKGKGMTGLSGWLRRNVTLDWTFGVREETTHDPAWEVFLLVPSALQNNGTTLFGNTTIRQDWSLLEGRKNVALTFRYLREDIEDNRFQGVNENRLHEEDQLRLSRSLSQKFTILGEGGRFVDTRNGRGIPSGTGSSYDILGWWLLGGVGLRFSSGGSGNFDVKVTTQSDSESGAQQDIVSIQPRLVWRVSDKINVFGSYEYSQAFDRGDAFVQPLPFQHAGDSHRWRLTPNVRLARVISIVASYLGRSETAFSGNRVTEHELRLETRALF